VTALERSAYRRADARLPRLLAGMSYDRVTDLRAHERAHGPLPLWGRSGRQRPERLIDLVERSGLTGRGGAGFPAGRKMRSVADAPGKTVMVANGAEGEPASGKDRLLLTRLPHLVLDGITLAASAVHASEAYLCVHGRERDLLAKLDYAVAEREAAGLDPVPIRLAGLPGRYVSSEQSAIVQHLNGGPGKPTFAPPRPHERGVKGRPTLVHNVETLAHLALIARHGDRWFRRVGLPAAPGTTLVTVGGAVGRPGVYEIVLGTPVGQVLMTAGGPYERLQAVLVGGYFGAWLPVEVAWQVPMCHGALKAAGGAMGAGIVIALPASACALAETARVVRYLAGENAGQCGPCMFGLPALADAVTDLAYTGGRGRAVDQVSALIPLIEGRGACRHPDGVTQLVRSALWAFEADARWHDHRGPCAGVGRAPLLPVPGEEEWAAEEDGDWLDGEYELWPDGEDRGWPGGLDRGWPGADRGWPAAERGLPGGTGGAAPGYLNGAGSPL
jgi:NADH:ubiquinone oxidoreductase subunit F (NADH-binding)